MRLSLVGPLPVDDGEVTFRFPLVVAPRYMPGAALGGEQAGLGAARRHRASCPTRRGSRRRSSSPAARTRCGSGCASRSRITAVRDVASSLHAVTTVAARRARRRGAARRAARSRLHPALARSTARSCAARWCAPTMPSGAAARSCSRWCRRARTAIAAKPRDVVFVIDRSGSMGGWKMVAARRAAARMIDTLTSRDRFCAIAFDNAVELLPGAGARRGDRSQPLPRRRGAREGRGARRHRDRRAAAARGGDRSPAGTTIASA